MRFDVITIFPRMIQAGIGDGVIHRGVERGLLSIGVHDLRDYTIDRHRTVDDVPYGGGPGMVMKVEPFARAVEFVAAAHGRPDAVIMLSPQGERFTQRTAERIAGLRHVLLLCGRYEGIDERVSDLFVTQEVSIGDYVLSGGELAALVVIDAAGRLVPGVVGDAQSIAEDSFSRGLLDHPHYTRPAEFAGRRVPDVLLSGHHQDVRNWRRRAAVARTHARRPELLADVALEDDERAWLNECRKEMEK